MLYLAIVLACLNTSASSCQIFTHKISYASEPKCLQQVELLANNFNSRGIIAMGICAKVSLGEDV